MHLPDTRIGLEEGHRMALIELIRDLRPRIVLAPYKHDRHPDHEATARLAVEACFFAGVEAVGKGRPHRPQQLYHYMIHTDFAPSFIVDISGQWEQKMSVLNAYGSQFTPGDGPATPLSTGDFLRVQSARGRHYGAMIGVARGEPFFRAGPLPADGFPTLAAHRQSQGGAPPHRTR